MDATTSPLARLLGEELSRPCGEAARLLGEEIRRRHAGAVVAILFYGSCLRRQSAEGVLDFYVLVDSYRAAYRSRRLALANAALPPNVLYCEIPAEGAHRLRCKYAVMTQADFARAATGALEARVWARFAQPTALVWARDEECRADAIAAVTEATATNVRHALAWLPGHDPVQRFTPQTLWETAFRETYRAELRGEHAETIAGLYAAAPARYEAVTAEVLRELERGGRLRVLETGPVLAVESDPGERARLRRSWRLRRPLAKLVAFAKLVKTAGTFDDWVPYILWKVERHSGEPVEVTERQRRHPLVFGWPVLFRLIRRRVLR